MGPCFSNQCVLPFHIHFHSHAIAKYYGDTSVLKPPSAKSSLKRSPLGGQTGFTPAAQEYQLEPAGNSRTSLSTWFSDPIPHLFDTVRNSRRDTVLARHNHRLQTGRRRGLLGCCFACRRREVAFLPWKYHRHPNYERRLPSWEEHPSIVHPWMVCVRRSHSIGMGLCVCPVGRKDGITSLFDTPAYLTPSLETVFDSIMQTFPTSRSTVKSGEDCAEQVGEGA